MTDSPEKAQKNQKKSSINKEKRFHQKLLQYKDLFEIKSKKGKIFYSIIIILCCILTGMWLSSREIVEISTDFYEKVSSPEKVYKELLSVPLNNSEYFKKYEDMNKINKGFKPKIIKTADIQIQYRFGLLIMNFRN